MPAKPVRQASRALDERLGSTRALRATLNRVFPDHWSFMLGELAVYCLVVLVVTGVWLSFFYVPSDATVTYHGSYPPLHGQKMSLAYRSVIGIDLQVRAGNFIRQMHHWAANLLLGSLVLHTFRTFFTGAFRKPRDLNWVIGVTLILLAFFAAFTGLSLPGDLISGMGLKVGYSIALSVPVFGNWIAFLVFGGRFPSDQIFHRLYIAHVFLIPALLAGLLGLHLLLVLRQQHTQFPGRGRSARRVVGAQAWPTHAARAAAAFCGVFAICALLGGLAQINPVWEWGPFSPARTTIYAEPGWYAGWLEGALMLFPAWRLHLWGYTVSELFWPGIVFPTVFFGVLSSWPWIERRVTGDRGGHNLLQHPRDAAVRTGWGVAGITLLVVLTIAGGQDFVGHYLGTTVPPITLGLRGLAILAPPIAGVVAWRVCKNLRKGGWLPETQAPLGRASEEATAPAKRFMIPRTGTGAGDGGRDGVGERPPAGQRRP